MVQRVGDAMGQKGMHARPAREDLHRGNPPRCGVTIVGGGDVAAQLVGGHVDSSVNNPIEAVAQWRAGELRPLCVFDSKRIELKEKVTADMGWADIPTCKEEGLDIEYLMLRGFFTTPGATPDQVAMEGKRLARAPLVIAVVSRAGTHVKIPEWEQVLSAGAAATSLVFAAHAMGFAASWLTEWYAYDRRVLDALGLAPNERIAGFVHIGRAVKPTEDRPRPPLNEIVTRYNAN